MDLNSFVLGADMGTCLTLIGYNLAVAANRRDRRCLGQAAANRELKKVNGDLFWVGFKAERLRSWMRSAE